ncbi:MAG: acyl-CoA dehydrogenase family protein, partial [Betaproteobacteria bacterium]|nr:acyl-CoA dehydrogenase family protein [Betaproteobacteria bacterium]
MSTMREILVDSASRLFGDVCTRDAFASAEEGLWQADLWATLEAAGLPKATLSEARGGAGADLGDALAVVREMGAACLPAPLAETMLAELALSAAGLAPRAGPLTIGPVLTGDAPSLVRRGDDWEI